MSQDVQTLKWTVDLFKTVYKRLPNSDQELELFVREALATLRDSKEA